MNMRNTGIKSLVSAGVNLVSAGGNLVQTGAKVYAGLSTKQQLGVGIPLGLASSVLGGYALGKWVFASSKFWPVFFGPAAGIVVDAPVQALLGTADDAGTPEAASAMIGAWASVPLYDLAAYAGLRLARK